MAHGTSGARSHDGSQPTAPAARLNQDTLAAWIRESAPPVELGSTPIELGEPVKSQRPIRHSGIRVSASSLRRQRLLRGLRAGELLLCVLLWLALSLWLMSTALRGPTVIAPIRNLAQSVATLHAHGVAQVEHLAATLAEALD